MLAETSASALARETRLGPIRVRVDEDRLAAFRRETGFEERANGVVPTCFLSVWLSSREVHGAIVRQFAGEDAVPVHESQSFHCRLPLRGGESYELLVTLRREETPPRIVMDADVATLDGDLCLRARTVLRIMSRKGVAA